MVNNLFSFPPRSGGLENNFNWCQQIKANMPKSVYFNARKSHFLPNLKVAME